MDVRDSFAPVAANYVTSSFHAGPEHLDEVIRLADPQASEEVLDVATGTGNTALALAPHVGRVIGLDLTPEMLAQAMRLGIERGLNNVEWRLGDAQSLPFADSSFDLWTARAAPHHFSDLSRALVEAFRVLRPGGRAVVVDGSGPAQARDLMHRVEVLRDPSHVLMRTLEEWRYEFEAAGFIVDEAVLRELEWEFEPWITRIGFPADRVPELAAIVESATGPAREQLQPERRHGRLWHRYWHALIRAHRP